MIRFTIVPPIRQDLAEVHVLVGLRHHLGQIPKVVTGPAADQATGDQVGPRVTDNGQLRPGTTMVGIALATPHEVRTDMPSLQTGGIQSPLGPFSQQMQGLGAAKDRPEQPVKSPFFPSRFSA
jgi:hypothetical protein